MMPGEEDSGEGSAGTFEEGGWVTAALLRERGRVPAALLRAEQPAATIATEAASAAARGAWIDAGRPGKLLYLAADPDPVAVRLDLRPWGKRPEPLALTEEGGTGLAPRVDVW